MTKALINPKAVGICLGLFLIVFAVSGMPLAESRSQEESAWLGVQLQALNDDLKEAMEMDDGVEGVLIAEVLDDSPADEAGLEDGDVVTAIDGEEMESVTDLVAFIRDHSPGDEVRVQVIRDGRRRTFRVELGESDADYRVGKIRIPDVSDIGDDVHKWVQEWRDDRGYLGVHILDLNDDLGRYFKVKEGEGVLITEVAEDSPAEDAGLMAGDVVLEYDGKEIKNTAKFRKYVARTDPGDEVSLVVKRRGRSKNIEVEIGEMEWPVGQFMDNFRMPSARTKGRGRILIEGDDGEVEVYDIPGGAGHVRMPHKRMPGARRMIIEGLDDLEDLEELEELRMENLEDFEDMQEMIKDLRKEMEELREELEELKE